MDSKTRRRLETTRGVMALLDRNEKAREWLPPSAQPVIVALKDDLVGDVLDRVTARYGIECDTWVLMRRARHRFHRVRVRSHGDDVSEAPDGPVSRDAEWGMLVDYLDTQGGRALTVTAVPGFVFAEAALV